MASLLQAGFAGSASAATDENEIQKFFTFTFENDVFIGEDDGYTNGTGITVGTANFDNFDTTNTPRWINWLIKDRYINTAPDKKRAIAHMFFQRMQTPEDITIAEFTPNDLPYAGLLAWQGTAYAWDENVSDQMSMFLGVVGPIAFGDEAQTLIHEIISSDEPLGWDNQLRNEPIVKIKLQRTWKLLRNENHRFQYDIVGLGGIGAGNLKSDVQAGLAVRFGTNLGKTMGAFSLQADRHVNPLAFYDSKDFYFFAGARVGYVANDILIDGNTFTDSPSIPLEHVQDEIAGGALWSLGRWAFVFSLSSSSSRTTIRNDREEFGAISVTFRH